MEIPPQQEPLVEENGRADSATERRQRDLLSIVMDPILQTPSWGERLQPYLVAMMETCWVDAILVALASINLFQRRTPLLPLWAPFVLIASAFWLITHLERREVIREQVSKSGQKTKMISGSSLFILLITLLVLLVIWASIYSSSLLFFDPRWLLALLNDLFSLSPDAYYVFVLVALSVYFCWRGIRLARHTIEPGRIFWTLRLGMGIIIVAIVLHAGSGAGFLNELILLCLIPLFLFCALVAHALAKAIFVRRYHPVGLQGSVAVQERALLSILGIIGLTILLLALVTGFFASPVLLADIQRALEPVGRAYDWLISVIAYGITFLLYPIFWLLSLLHIHPAVVRIRQYQNPLSKNVTRSQNADPIVLFVVPILKIVLPVLFVVLMVWLMSWLLRRRHLTLVRREQQDMHESLWSWKLFQAQVKTFLLAIWRRFFPQRSSKQTQTVIEEISGEPTARTIREIYRAFLHWAASRGYERKKEETPYEFKLRLHQQLPQIEPELGNLTEAYSTLRYGGMVPGDAEVTRAQTDWATLQHKPLA